MSAFSRAGSSQASATWKRPGLARAPGEAAGTQSESEAAAGRWRLRPGRSPQNRDMPNRWSWGKPKHEEWPKAEAGSRQNRWNQERETGAVVNDKRPGMARPAGTLPCSPCRGPATTATGAWRRPTTTPATSPVQSLGRRRKRPWGSKECTATTRHPSIHARPSCDLQCESSTAGRVTSSVRARSRTMWWSCQS